MASQIDLQPQILNLGMYSGDGFSFKLLCTDVSDAPIDLRGVAKAQIRADRLTPEDDPILEFNVSMVDAYLGIVVLSLTGDETQQLTDQSTNIAKFSGVWDLEWTPDGLEPRTICQGNVECVADVTR